MKRFGFLFAVLCLAAAPLGCGESSTNDASTPMDTGTQTVKHCLLNEIRRWTNIVTLWDFENSPGRVAAGDAHESI